MEKVYRILQAGELIQEGDEFQGNPDKPWEPVGRGLLGYPICTEGIWRRPAAASSAEASDVEKIAQTLLDKSSAPEPGAFSVIDSYRRGYRAGILELREEYRKAKK
jgi:hypothetical protein